MIISLERLVRFFEETRQMKRDGSARFDIDQVCRWSYFMVDRDRDKLTRVGQFLEAQGYELDGFLGPAVDDEKKMIYLRFDRVEQHTPETLFTRGVELDRIAGDFGLEDYDGMDVGAIDGP